MTPPEESSEQDLTLKKLQLEIKQLELDLRRYDERLILSDRKLRSDVRDWYWRILVALVSTIVGVVTFLWAQSYQRYTDDFKAASTRIEEDDKAFYDALDKLSNPSPSVRLAAADRLVTFAETDPSAPQPPSAPQKLWAFLVGRTDSTELFQLAEAATVRRKVDSIQSAADRLHFEDDVRVMQLLARVLLAGGNTSIPYVADINRSLANDLARNFGSLIANDWTGNRISDACDSWQTQPVLTRKIDDLVVRVQMPYQGSGGELRFQPSQLFLHSFTVRPFVTIQCNLESMHSGGHVVTSDIADMESSAIRNARALALTSYVLVTHLKSVAAENSQRVNLEGVQLVTGTGSDRIAWRNVNFDNAYLPGTPGHFSCRSCSFRSAAMQDLKLVNGSDLANSDMSGAHFQ